MKTSELELGRVIGLFFGLCGVLLVGYALLEKGDGAAINLYCGVAFFLFGAGMLLSSKSRIKRLERLKKSTEGL